MCASYPLHFPARCRRAAPLAHAHPGCRPQVTLVGKIIMMKTMQSNGLMEFKLYDGTGTFLIIYYLNEEDEMVTPPSCTAPASVQPHIRIERCVAAQKTFAASSMIIVAVRLNALSEVAGSCRKLRTCHGRR